MNVVDFKKLIDAMRGQTVMRPNKADAGTLSGHAAGEPFEKLVYHKLKESYPDRIFKQFEFLNDLYLKHPRQMTVEQRRSLCESPTALFLLSRSDSAIKSWTPNNLFEEKQNDTADIVCFEEGIYDLIDVKTRNTDKNAMAPNIISAYKLAQACALMIDNAEYDAINFDYVEIDWHELGEILKCTDAHHGSLFKACPESLYINWAAAMQIQFHVCELDQSWTGTVEEWAHQYIKVFVKSAEHRIEAMRHNYVMPFLKYIKE